MSEKQHLICIIDANKLQKWPCTILFKKKLCFQETKYWRQKASVDVSARKGRTLSTGQKKS
jgi:hypothetical protein